MHAEPFTPPPAAPAAAAAPLRATARFMRTHPAHWIALGFGSGLSPVAPGTAGTLWAWLAWLVLSRWLDTAALGMVLAASAVVGWWACTVTARHLNDLDPSNIVWDEVVAFWLVLWLVMPAGFWTQLVAFVLFRVFDAVKRGPVGWADRRKGASGVMLDDIIAGALAAGLLLMARWLGVTL